MLTSSADKGGMRPVRPANNRGYRRSTDKFVAAAIRCGVPVGPPTIDQASDPTQYEFPGDLTNRRMEG